MKKVILIGTLTFCSFFSQAQIVTLNGSKVEVRDEKGNYISSNSYSGINDAVGGNGIVVLWFENGKVEVRDSKLSYISSNSYSNLKSVKVSGRNVVLQFNGGKIEIRDEKLSYVSSR